MLKDMQRDYVNATRDIINSNPEPDEEMIAVSLSVLGDL